MVIDILTRLRAEIEQWLKDAGITEPVVILERSASSEFGEYSTNVAMKYAKLLGKNPMEIAETLVSFLSEKRDGAVEKIEFVRPGFVNFYFTPTAKIEHVDGINKLGDAFGKSTNLAGQKWVIEHTSPNPNKAMHLGHMRNNFVGMGIVRLLKNSGAEVVSDAVYNNRGISIAKNMYGYLAHMKKDESIPTDLKYWFEHQDEWFTPEEKNLRPDLFVTECYVLGEKDFSSNPEIEHTVRQMVINWEAHDEATWKLWAQVLQYAYDGVGMTLDRLGSHWDNVWYEHEHYQEGKDYVEKGLKMGLFKKLEDGAVLTDIEEKYNIPETILLKKDGTSLYITQDIALVDLKKKTYGADKLVWVVGPEQTLAFRQLFAVCEQLGIGEISDFTHIAYGYVGLKNEDGSFKKMSSRAGTVVMVDDVIDGVKTTIKKRFDEDDRHTEEVKEDLAEKLALAAVKFAFLKSDSNMDLSFDIEQSVDVHGDSGMYVMYSYVRTQSILRKAGAEGAGQSTTPSQIGSEAELLRTLLYFEDVVSKSVADLSVHHISQYLLELSSEFNTWYAKETILDGSEYQSYKLSLVRAVGVTMKNALAIVGIETVDEI